MARNRAIRDITRTYKEINIIKRRCGAIMVAQAVVATVVFAVFGYAAYKYTEEKFNK